MMSVKSRGDLREDAHQPLLSWVGLGASVARLTLLWLTSEASPLRLHHLVDRTPCALHPRVTVRGQSTPGRGYAEAPLGTENSITQAVSKTEGGPREQ